MTSIYHKNIYVNFIQTYPGLESVIADLPTLFFENIIKKGHMLILTGISEIHFVLLL